jgi:hypothetical protein
MNFLILIFHIKKMSTPPRLAFVFLDALRDLNEELDIREYKSKYAISTYISNLFFCNDRHLSKCIDETHEIMEYHEYCWSTAYKTLLDINYIFSDKSWKDCEMYLKNEGFIQEITPSLYRFNYEGYSYLYNTVFKSLTISTYVSIKDIKYISEDNQKIILNNLERLRNKRWPPFLRIALETILKNLNDTDYKEFKSCFMPICG